ncbi:MAG TPA: hypothetical protein VMG30_14720 [Acidobacteriota bacterium]|nr:hypothetical protein [Acidobacteriota bacterium]
MKFHQAAISRFSSLSPKLGYFVIKVGQFFLQQRAVSWIACIVDLMEYSGALQEQILEFAALLGFRTGEAVFDNNA